MGRKTIFPIVSDDDVFTRDTCLLVKEIARSLRPFYIAIIWQLRKSRNDIAES